MYSTNSLRWTQRGDLTKNMVINREIMHTGRALQIKNYDVMKQFIYNSILVVGSGNTRNSKTVSQLGCIIITYCNESSKMKIWNSAAITKTAKIVLVQILVISWLMNTQEIRIEYKIWYRMLRIVSNKKKERMNLRIVGLVVISWKGAKENKSI